MYVSINKKRKTFLKLLQRSVSALREKGQQYFSPYICLRGQHAARELWVDRSTFRQTPVFQQLIEQISFKGRFHPFTGHEGP